ncbi:PLP-dependent aspartate aminotransferase family protein [Gammaproteobacteria bacterium]|jgi:cystathionine gamma-lyase|nr:PLP-dependent aspartate aminotransferase family protein [Gammaproteobacteria bacterium]
MSKKNKEGFETRAIHAGQKADPTTGAVMMPIYTSSTYEQESPGVHKGFDYSRSINPTRKAFEECIASLENGEVGFGFSSGVAAISACVELLSPGDHVIAMNDLYGGTVRLFNEIKTLSQGIEVTYVDMTDMQNVLEAKTDKTKMIFVETPTNPLLRVVDLSAIADFAKAENILSVCDNTFASPYVQQPLNHGIDIVLHSATKYLGGHSDLIAGALVIGKKDDALVSKMANIVNSLGPITGAFDSYLILRSLKTLAVRMERHSENAMAIAKHFESHKEISEVIYPGLTNHPQHDLASKQMNGFGGIISMNIKGGLEKSKSFLERTKIFALAESLGGVESLIEHPALMTHASLPKDRREMIGISDGLVRLSVGLESLDDLVEDIEQALK